MKKQSIDNLKLGLFVIAGLVILIVGLYMLSKNRTFFGNRLELSAQFRDVNGLLVGNNVRFNGINVGNIRSIKILNDTAVEVQMSLKDDMKSFIKNNAIASIGTDGLIGNRIINITPSNSPGDFIQGGEQLPTKEEVDTDAMLRTLDKTNKNIVEITDEIKTTVHNIRQSSELNKILNDSTLSLNLSLSLKHLRETTAKASSFASNAIRTLQTFTEGSGTISTLLTDTTLSDDLKQIVNNMQKMESRADLMLNNLNQTIEKLSDDINNGGGSFQAILKDSITANRLKKSIENVEKGTASFAEDMEALQRNFLLRPYFKKKQKEAERKALSKDTSTFNH